MGQAAQQAGEGGGLEMQQMHQVVGVGRLWKQRQDRQGSGQQGCHEGWAPAPGKSRSHRNRSAPNCGFKTGGRSDWAKEWPSQLRDSAGFGIGIPHRAFPVSFAG